ARTLLRLLHLRHRRDPVPARERRLGDRLGGACRSGDADGEEGPAHAYRTSIERNPSTSRTRSTESSNPPRSSRASFRSYCRPARIASIAAAGSGAGRLRSFSESSSSVRCTASASRIARGARQWPHTASRSTFTGAPQLEQRTCFTVAFRRWISTLVSERTKCFSRRNWKNVVKRPCR